MVMALNVLGTELERLREFFQRYSQRLEVPVTVAEVGDPFEPQSTYVDLTGARPDEVPELLAEVLGVHQASITDVAFLYDDGFERMDLSDMESAESLHAFLVSNTRDCKMEARFSEMAVVTLWNATDDGYLGRAEVGTLIRTAPEGEASFGELAADFTAFKLSPRFQLQFRWGCRKVRRSIHGQDMPGSKRWG